MCLAASGTLAAMKHRAIEPVNKVKILPVIFKNIVFVFKFNYNTVEP
jgi:hypothetical protein